MKIHILTGDGVNYHAAIHYAVPPGLNSAGRSWSYCIVDDGKNTTILGNLQAEDLAEYNEIVAGTTVELVYQIKKMNSGGGTVASINEIVDRAIVENKKHLQRLYDQYGRAL